MQERRSGCTVVSLAEVLGQIRDKIHDVRLLQKVEQALEVIDKAFRDYTVEETALSFNGGKDCTILLHLLSLFISDPPRARIVAIYFYHPKCFPEVAEFVSDGEKRYNLDLITTDKSFQEGLVEIKNSRPTLRAIFMGTRKSDPKGDRLSFFTMTDPGWGDLMRVNPLLEWSYEDVWGCMLALGIPYCCLYDKGYTSLGLTTNTFPNPALRIDGSDTYAPAHTLRDGTGERYGRRQEDKSK